MTYCLKMPLLNCIIGKNESILLIILLLRENYSFPAPFCGLRDLFNFDKEKRQYYTTICLKNHHSRSFNFLLRYLLKVKARGGVQAQKLDFLYFLTVKSSTFVGIITFYRMRISFDTLKILAVKVRTYCQIYGIFNTI